jgi:hypothetical protein
VESAIFAVFLCIFAVENSILDVILLAFEVSSAAFLHWDFVIVPDVP